jgi:hypothetical protein
LDFGQGTHPVPDIPFLRALLPTFLPGERLRLGFHDGSTVVLGVGHGPRNICTTVGWQENISPYPVLKEVPHEQRAYLKLRHQYPAHFGFPGVYGHSLIAAAPVEGVLYTFNEQLDLLFAYRYHRQDLASDDRLQQLGAWPIWKKVDASKVHVYVGELPAERTDAFSMPVRLSSSGFFCTLELIHHHQSGNA